MSERVLVLGAGFGGLELSTMLSEAGIEVTLIDHGEAFVFGFSKLDVEVGDGRVARVDIDFLSGPEKTGTFQAPSLELAAEKERFGSSRRERWFAAR